MPIQYLQAREMKQCLFGVLKEINQGEVFYCKFVGMIQKEMQNVIVLYIVWKQAQQTSEIGQNYSDYYIKLG